MLNIDINQAQQHLPELVEKTITDGEIIITKGGQPIAKIVAISKPKKQRQFGMAKGLIRIADDFDEPLKDFEEYM